MKAPKREGSWYRVLLAWALGAASLVAIPAIVGAAPASCGGTVFEDFDNDGEIAEDYSHVAGSYSNTPDPGIPNVVVTVVDAAGNVFTDTTNSDGDWGVIVDDGDFPIRVEITPPDGYGATQRGPNSNTTVQFIDAAGDCDVSNNNGPIGSAGLAIPGSYCATVPELATTCFLFGDADGHDDEPAVVTLPDGAVDNRAIDGSNFQDDPYTVRATLGQVGSIWGIDVTDDDVIYGGSFIKRHARIGPNGNPTTIYAIPPGGAPTPWYIVDPSATDPHSGATEGWRFDNDAFDDVYTQGLGDVELSPDDSTLYTIDLGRRMLVAIDITNAGSPGAVTETPLTAANLGTPCGDADIRPYGLGVHADGTVYVGVVCSAESTVDTSAFPIDRNSGLDQNGNPVGDASQLTGHVFSFAGAGFTQVMAWSFDDFNRGSQTGGSNFQAQSDWRPWVSQSPYQTDFTSFGWPDQGHAFAQPAVTDIEFDGADLIIGIGDRYGHQKGADAFYQGADGNDYGSGQPVSSGDLLRAEPGGPGWVIAPAPPAELYEDNYGSGHSETALGAQAQIPGRPYTISANFDPIPEGNSWRSGGLTWYDNTTGEQVTGYRLYSGHPNYVDEGTFEKAAGIGDVEAICGQAPIEVGNFVWFDANRDGQQGPTETAMVGVVVELLDAAGNVVATTTTDANGEYYFNADNVPGGLINGAAYTIQIAQVNYDAGGVFADGGVYEDHPQVTNPDQGGDQTDSDAVQAAGGLPTIAIVAGDDPSTSAVEGASDHTYDFGFVLDFDLALVKTYVTGPDAFESGETVTFDVTIVNQANTVQTVTITDYIQPGLTFDPADNPAISGVDTDGDPFTGTWTTVGSDAEIAVDFSSAVFAEGDELTVPITLRISDGWTGNNLVNWAEISNFDGDGNPDNGDAASGYLGDIDSTPDANQANDDQPTGPGAAGDDVIDNTDGDEDDHDVAGVPPFYDVSLIKELAPGQSYAVDPAGDLTGSFAITVKNQGPNAVYNLDVTDYLPAGTSFASLDGVTAGTATVTDEGGTATTHTFGIDGLAPADEVTFEITLSIDDINLDAFVNGAEVSAMEDATGAAVDDIDSTPDAVNDDDIVTTPGIDPNGNDDDNSHNDIDHDRDASGAPIDTTSNAVPADDRDEDDHDTEVLILGSTFDLALQKGYVAGPDSFTAGATVTFDVTITNQSDPVQTVTITDYVQAGLVFDAADNAPVSGVDSTGDAFSGTWAAAGTDAEITLDFGSAAFAQDDVITIPITLQVADDWDGSNLVNWAEISNFDDDANPGNGDGASGDLTDADSTPDTTQGNDPQPAGPGEPGDGVIDNTDGDEDDHDVAGVPPFYDVSLIKELAPGQAYSLDPIGSMDVSYAVTVKNQGPNPVFDLEVTDYLPAGTSFTSLDGVTAGTATVTDEGGTATTHTFGIDDLLPGEQVTFELTVTIDDETLLSYVNGAEVSAMADDAGNPVADIDSTPDAVNDDEINTTPGIDPNGNNAANSHNDIDDDRDASGAPIDTTSNAVPADERDEDDHDTEVVVINPTLDLALRKNIDPTSADLADGLDNGDVIRFNVEIFNQGIAASDVEVTDYIQPGFEFEPANNPDGSTDDALGLPFTWDVTDPANPVVSTTGVIPTGSSIIVPVYVTVDISQATDQLDNYAEISRFDDTDPDTGDSVTDPANVFDADSTPDDDNTNDTLEDNVTDNSGGDEDDHDIASTRWFDLSLIKERSATQDYVIDASTNLATVSFDISVKNQGPFEVYDVGVSDDFPAELAYAAANPATATSGARTITFNGDGTFVIDQIDPDETVTFTVLFELDLTNPVPDRIINGAEITSMFGLYDTDGDGSVEPTPVAVSDVDSTPDDQPGDTFDPAGTVDPDDGTNDLDAPGDEDDSLHDLDTVDEDDQDTEVVVAPFDLALRKELAAPTTIYAGGDANFTIQVFNQGPRTAGQIDVVDYIDDAAWEAFDLAGQADGGTGMAVSIDGATIDYEWLAAGDGTFDPIVRLTGELAPGDSVIIPVTLTALDTIGVGTIENWAEIARFDSDADPDNGDSDTDPSAFTDVDSTPDSDPADDDQPTAAGEPGDDVIDNTGGDEDDHDVAGVPVEVFDLALEKSVASIDVIPVLPGTSKVTFSMTVTNEGTVPAYDIEVTDYIKPGFTFLSADNAPAIGGAVWFGADGATAPVTAIPGPLAPGESYIVNITLLVDASVVPGSVLDNEAEISGADDDDDPNTPAPTDVDSDPDNIPGDPDDEDDSDTAEVPTQVFDLALTKVLTNPTTLVSPGDDVSFTITVFNQGELTATDITVVDYLPTGLTLSANDTNGWVAVGGNIQNTIPGPLAAGDSATLTIVTTVADEIPDGDLVNYAEIVSALDEGGDPRPDIDSTPDADPGNDNGGDPLVDDNVTNNDGGDEDDHDPAVVPVVREFDLTIEKTVVSVDQNARRVTWQVVATNNGPDTALGPITIVDDLEPQLVYVSSASDEAECSLAGRMLTCVQAGSLASGDTITITVVTDAVSSAVTVTNSVQVSSVAGVPAETDETNNTDVAQTSFTTAAGATVTQPTTPPSSTQTPRGNPLALTGASTLLILWVGLGLLGLGAFFMFGSRRSGEER